MTTYVQSTIVPSAGIRYMLLSALGFAFMAACVKAAAAQGIPVFEIVAARAIVSLFISYFDVRRKRIPLWGNNKPLLIARGVVGSLALMCVYYAVTTLNLATATILQHTYPAFTAVLALIILKERIQKRTIACVVMSFAGVVVMVGTGLTVQGLSALPSISVVTALVGALGSAVAYVIVRRLGQSEDSSVIIFYFPLIALPVSIFLLGSNYVIPSFEGLLLLLLVGIFTQVGQIGMTKAMQHEEAGKATAYSYVQVVFAAVLGFVFFNEIPTISTFSGGSLIVAGALFNALFKPRKH